MYCANCGTTLKNSQISEDGYFFCDTICRYNWRQHGKPNPIKSSNKSHNKSGFDEIDYNFTVEPPGFENRKMTIRLSHWRAAKIYIDGEQLIPIKKRLFSMNREFNVVSNYGKNVSIRLKQIPLDLVPTMYIDGQVYPIARTLTIWEYIWICIPLILMFIGGAIGGLLGGVATYSNSILIRKIKNILLRYLFTGLTTVMSIILFIRIVGFTSPFLDSLLPLDQQLKNAASAINKTCPSMIDSETRLDSTNYTQGKNFSYYYTLINETKGELNIPAVKQIITDYIMHNIKTNEQLRFFRENEVAMLYKYYDKNGIDAFEIQVTPDDYK